MAIVNSSIPKTLNQQVVDTMETKGFSSKAEFFRFAAIYFIGIINKPFADENTRFNYLTKLVTEEIQNRYGNKKLPSAREQLADI